MSNTTVMVARYLRNGIGGDSKRQLNMWTRNLSSTLALNNINIDVSPKKALLDDPPRIRVEGLNKNQKVTLRNTYTDDVGLLFSTHAHYVADGDGVVDVQHQMSFGGRYKGLFPEGLVASLHSAPPVYEATPKLQWARLYKKDVTNPMKYILSVVDGHVEEGEFYSSKVTPKIIGETDFYRHLMGEGVTRSELENDVFKGVLFKPAGEGPFPVVIDLFGAESGTKEFRSAMLASYGYASLVLPYYQYKDLPPLKNRLDMDYFLNAVDYLDSMPGSVGSRIGIMGSSKGGEIALAVTSLSDKIKACLTINCYNKSVDVDFFYKNEVYVKRISIMGENAVMKSNKKGQLITYGADKMYTWDSPVNLPVDKIRDNCEVLIAAGDEDGGQAHRSALAMKEISRRAKKKNLNMVVYPGAGHLLDPPFHSHIEAVWNSVIQIRQPDGSQVAGIPHYYGGTPYAMVQATKDLWKRTLALFHKKLVQENGLPMNTTKLNPPY